MKIKICRQQDLAEGSVRTAKVLARTIAVIRIDGELYGLEADCKHMKASIARGKIEGHTITCPAHGWQYDIRTGACLNEPWAQLKTFPVVVEDGQVCVEVSV
ncbi:MAG: Rieske (2Fe-2S) protein [Candidatus Zixiibacteriota bacterium]|nr:MAG: Rieske (2Fe-2S) protein [candidate division Zixibacteria bacterium]